jgi:hypothetical protein
MRIESVDSGRIYILSLFLVNVLTPCVRKVDANGYEQTLGMTRTPVHGVKFTFDARHKHSYDDEFWFATGAAGTPFASVNAVSLVHVRFG